MKIELVAFLNNLAFKFKVFSQIYSLKDQLQLELILNKYKINYKNIILPFKKALPLVKYENNPIFSKGEAGDWDEGAIWFTTVQKINGIYYMWYEGYGGGTARVEPYGTYLKGGKSQIGIATLEAEYFYVIY